MQHQIETLKNQNADFQAERNLHLDPGLHHQGNQIILDLQHQIKTLEQQKNQIHTDFHVERTVRLALEERLHHQKNQFNSRFQVIECIAFGLVIACIIICVRKNPQIKTLEWQKSNLSHLLKVERNEINFDIFR